MPSQRVSLNQITEWLENPVTIAFRLTCEAYRDDVIDEGGLNGYTEFEPQKTAETLAKLTGRGQTWQEIIEILEGGDWELDDEE